MKNPFQFGKIIEDNAFCNRIEELKTLKKYIKNGYSVWLYSPRRFGKTSLIKKIFRETEGINTIYFDFYNINSIEEFSKKYAETIAKNLFNWKDDITLFTNRLGQIFKGLYPNITIDPAGNSSLSLGIKEINKQQDIDTILNAPEQIARKRQIQICIAFDEFQEINNIHPQIIRWMRSAFQNQQSVSYIFLGSRQSLMNKIFTDTKSVFYEFGIKMNLSSISEEDWVVFILKKFKESSLTIPKNQIHAILNKSRCHPHFTQFFASVVWDLIYEGYNPQDINFENTWMNKIIESQTIIFQNIFDNLNKNQRKILQALASGDEVKIFSSSIKNQFQLPANSTTNIAIKSLIEKAIIYKHVTSYYRIINPVFNEWIRQL